MSNADVSREAVSFSEPGIGTLEFGAKEKVKKLSQVKSDGVNVQFAFRNGQVRTFWLPLDHSLFMQAAKHGLDQKFGDEFAGLADPDDCVEAFDAMAERIEAGEWNQARASDGLAGLSVLAKAMVRLSGKTIESVKATLKTLTAAQKSALRKTPAVAEVVAAIEAEREARKPDAKKVDTNELLSRFA